MAVFERRYSVRPCKRRACGELFRPRARRLKGGIIHVTEYCSWVCATAATADAARGKPLTKATNARARQARDQHAERLMEAFGPMTDRELKLVARAEAHGYQRGYNVAYGAASRRLQPKAS